MNRNVKQLVPLNTSLEDAVNAFEAMVTTSTGILYCYDAVQLNLALTKSAGNVQKFVFMRISL